MADTEEPAEAKPVARLNPGGFVYGVLAVATVVAAESTRRDTFPKLAVASAINVALYWLAHAYSQDWGSRMRKGEHSSLSRMTLYLTEESPILVGAAFPWAVLLVAWLAGAGIDSAVTAVLWSAALELVLLEIWAGVRRKLNIRDLAAQTLIGVGMALGILGLRIILH